MDNADKIDFTHKEVALFLGDDLKQQNQKEPKQYNLEEEYAKTPKNTQKKVWLLLALCFFVVGAGTILTTALVSNSNQKIAVKIDTFNDLNLRSLLNMVGRSQSSYDNAVRQKENLEIELKDSLEQALQKRDNDLFTLKSVASVSTKDSIQARQEKIQENYEEAVKKAHAEFDPQIENIIEEIKRFEGQINGYDAGMLSKAREAESSIDSQKQLHDMEMKSQASNFTKKIKELRVELINQQIKANEEQRAAVEEVRQIYQAKIDQLDPKAREQSSDQDKIILGIGIENSASSTTLWNSVDELNFIEENFTSTSKAPSENFTNALSKSQKNLQNLKTIAMRFKPIPMENSIKDYVPAMLRHSYQIANDMAEGQQKMQAEIDKLQQEVDFQNSFLEHFVTQLGCDGVILNSADEGKMKIYISEAKRSLFENAPTLNAQITTNTKTELTLFIEGNDYFAAKKAESDDGKKKSAAYQIQTGDKITIILQKK
ncbi:MAG: hypothetical protein KBT11_03630 [Treponema sp.]|nr:hypothetical protein [Candidatus Treponema equifaecale]